MPKGSSGAGGAGARGQTSGAYNPTRVLSGQAAVDWAETNWDMDYTKGVLAVEGREDFGDLASMLYTYQLGSLDLNRALNEGHDLSFGEQLLADSVDRTLRPLPQDFILERTMVLRTPELRKMFNSKDPSVYEGTLISNKGFTSTTLDTGGLPDYPNSVISTKQPQVHLIIRAKKGQVLAAYPENATPWMAMHEVLLQRGVRLKVTKVLRVENADNWKRRRYVMEAEIV